MMTSIKNSFCASLARVKIYTHTKNRHVGYVYWFSSESDYRRDDDNAGRHSTITGAIYS